MSGICPVSGEECNNFPVFIIVEQLGDKAQSTSCCRRCAETLIRSRNSLALTKTLEAHGVSVVPAEEFINRVFKYAQKNPQTDKNKSCPSCGWTLDAILKSNRLGCSYCYTTFRDELIPHIEQQDEHRDHMSKIPLAVRLSSLPPDQQLKLLEESMSLAVGKENYEEAAKLRDMIKKIKEASSPQE